MSDRHYIFIDATSESHASFYSESPLFKPWLHSYDNITQAIQHIKSIQEPYSIEIYLARDNMLDDVLLSNTNGQTTPLIHALCDLITILHVTIFCPEINPDLEEQFRKTISQPRLIKKVISTVNLGCFMCLEGILYFEQKRTNCIATNEAHLTRNLRLDEDNLMNYLRELIDDRKAIEDVLIDEHSNKPSAEAS